MKKHRCPHCKESKPLNEFYENNENKSGHNHVCKACKQVQNKEGVEATKMPGHPRYHIARNNIKENFILNCF